MGVAEVLHVKWRQHSYPAHPHDTWALLLSDDGLIGYEADRHGYAAHRAGQHDIPNKMIA